MGNASTESWNSSASVFDCGPTGCLFRLDIDSSEHHNMVDHEPDRAARMLAAIKQSNASTFSPHRGQPDMETACRVALQQYRGFWGPFVDPQRSVVESVVI